MTHVLDRPVWSALTSRHAALAAGDGFARRYRPGLTAFVSARDDDPESLRAMAGLVGEGESLFLLQADPIRLPPDLAATLTAKAVQMVAARAVEAPADAGAIELGQVDAPEMLELATLTRPGPFSLRSLELGRFWGVRLDGRLAAMAGERMKQKGFTEISGVCAHPDFRGRGLARMLSQLVANKVQQRGETPYLHAYASNEAAIGLYESIGFRLRTEMNVAMVERDGAV
jgi:predicted GNAT family acetyltransferase